MTMAIPVFLLGFALASLLYLVSMPFFQAFENTPVGGDIYDPTVDTRIGTSLNASVEASRIKGPVQIASEPKRKLP